MSMTDKIVSPYVELIYCYACSYWSCASASSTGLCGRCTETGKESNIVVAGDHLISNLYSQGTTGACSMDFIIQETSGPAYRSRLKDLWTKLSAVSGRFGNEHDCELLINPISTFYTTGVVGSQQIFTVQITKKLQHFTFKFISCPGIDSTTNFFRKYYQITTAQYYFCLYCRQSYASEDHRPVHKGS